MTAALSAGRLDLISAAMQDRIHQPYRVPLVPGMSKILAEATSHGALGIALSGAGPTMIALVDRNDSRVEELSAYLVQTMKAEGISASCYPLNPVAEGVQLLEGINNRSFLDMIRGKLPHEKIALLPSGSVSHEAILYLLNGEPVEFVHHKLISDVFMSTVEGKSDYSVIPIENTIEGSVSLHMDWLVNEWICRCRWSGSILPFRT